MKKDLNFIIIKTLSIGALTACTALYAAENNEGQRLIYFGAGSASKSDPLKNSDTPLSAGFLNISNESNGVWGLDISGEGTKIEFTGGRTSVVQATSLNFLVGSNISKVDNTRFDAAFLIGGRTSSSSCPKSYLGYQCYADQPPSTSYAMNYGVLLTMTYKSLMVGLRATGESAQGIIGFRF